MVILGKSAGKSKRVEPHRRFAGGTRRKSLAAFKSVKLPSRLQCGFPRGTRGERGGISQNRVAERLSGECPLAPSTCFSTA